MTEATPTGEETGVGRGQNRVLEKTVEELSLLGKGGPEGERECRGSSHDPCGSSTFDD